MKYSIAWLKTQTAPDYLFFWGHQPSTEGSIGKTCLSQWWPADFNEDIFTYKTAEHYMMVQKAKLFGDKKIIERILQAASPKEAKELGREVENFDPEKWDEEKYWIVKRGNLLKFSQHKVLEQFLIHTGNKILVEASPVDAIWGIGLSENDPNAKNCAAWRGQNLLGFALMEVRNELNNKN